MASTLGTANPLRYRGYIYDTETGLYYLQSRYYNPEIGRFINADALISTGQGLLGNNMFAYCGNNPVMFVDPTGTSAISLLCEAFTKVFKFFILQAQINGVIPLSSEQKSFISTIAGEAISGTAQEQKAVGCTIMNRVKKPMETWSSVTCVTDVLKPQWYNAVGGIEYNKCLEYLNNRNGINGLYEDLIKQTLPIYFDLEADFTGGAHFIFNINTKDGKSFLEQLKTQPNRYVQCGPFEGVDENKFCMYKCLW